MLNIKFIELAGLESGEMAKKNECPYDCGGYFIVRGNEKVGSLPKFSILPVGICDSCLSPALFLGNSYSRARY